MRTKTGNVLLFLTLLATACGEESGDEGEELLDSSLQPGETADGGKADGGAGDAATGIDSSVTQDASTTADAAAIDSAVADATASDSGAADAAVTDAGMGDAAVAATTFTRVHTIITMNCAPCHTANASGNLKMNSKAAAYTALVGVTAMGGECSASARKRVIANDAAGSLLIRKLEGGPELCGARMPKDKPALSPALIAEIKSWINAGALNN
jgi:hypothetical protein